MFKKKIETLEQCLRADEQTTAEAASIMRTLIDRIIISPLPGRGSTSVEVRVEPQAIFAATAGATPSRMITVVAEEGLEPPTRGL